MSEGLDRLIPIADARIVSVAGPDPDHDYSHQQRSISTRRGTLLMAVPHGRSHGGQDALAVCRRQQATAPGRLALDGYDVRDGRVDFPLPSRLLISSTGDERHRVLTVSGLDANRRPATWITPGPARQDTIVSADAWLRVDSVETSGASEGALQVGAYEGSIELVLYRSTDRGETWHHRVVGAAWDNPVSHSKSALGENLSGRVFLWYRKKIHAADPGWNVVRHSDDDGATWSEERPCVYEGDAAAGMPFMFSRVRTLSNGDMVTVAEAGRVHAVAIRCSDPAGQVWSIKTFAAMARPVDGEVLEFDTPRNRARVRGDQTACFAAGAFVGMSGANGNCYRVRETHSDGTATWVTVVEPLPKAGKARFVQVRFGEFAFVCRDDRDWVAIPRITGSASSLGLFHTTDGGETWRWRGRLGLARGGTRAGPTAEIVSIQDRLCLVFAQYQRSLKLPNGGFSTIHLADYAAVVEDPSRLGENCLILSKPPDPVHLSRNGYLTLFIDADRVLVLEGEEYDSRRKARIVIRSFDAGRLSALLPAQDTQPAGRPLDR